MTLVYLKINLQVEHINFISVQWFHMMTHFDTEPRGNLELATCNVTSLNLQTIRQTTRKHLYTHTVRDYSHGVLHADKPVSLHRVDRVWSWHKEGKLVKCTCKGIVCTQNGGQECSIPVRISRTCQTTVETTTKGMAKCLASEPALIISWWKNKFLSFCKLLQGEKCASNLTVI